MEKRDPSCTVGGNVNWHNHYGKLNIELPYDPAIPLLGIYPDKVFLEKDTFTPMFTAALFTITKTWKQPQRPSKDEWMKKMWYIYTLKYYSAIKKNKIMPFAAAWMELEMLILSAVSQKEKDRYHMIPFIIWYLIYGTNNTIYRKETNSWA